MGLDVAQRKKRAAKAVAKQARSDAKLTREELRDVEWLQSIEREELLQTYLTEVPKGLYCQLAGRQQKVVDDQARRHQLPLLGATVDLFAATRAFHDLLTRHGDRLVEGATTAAELEREQLAHQRTKTKLAELELDQKMDTIVPRDELRELLASWEQRLRAFGELLGRRYGRDAQQSLNDFLLRDELPVEQPSRRRKKGAA